MEIRYTVALESDILSSSPNDEKGTNSDEVVGRMPKKIIGGLSKDSYLVQNLAALCASIAHSREKYAYAEHTRASGI